MFKKMSVSVAPGLRRRLTAGPPNPIVDGFAAALQLPVDITRFCFGASLEHVTTSLALRDRQELLVAALDQAGRLQAYIRDTSAGDRVVLELRFFEKGQKEPFETLEWSFTQQGQMSSFGGGRLVR